VTRNWQKTEISVMMGDGGGSRSRGDKIQTQSNLQSINCENGSFTNKGIIDHTS
jgi:hypothetical protein